MAGGVLKGFGGVLLALGLILVVGAIAAAIFAYVDMQDNRENGLFADGQRQEQDEAILVGAAAAGGIGLVLTVVGIVLLATGSGRANRAIVRATQQGPGQQAAVGTPAAVAAAPGPDATRRSSQPLVEAPVRSANHGTKVAAGIGIAVLALTVVVLAALFGPEGGIAAALGNDDADEPMLVEQRSGDLGSSITLMGVSQGAGDAQQPEPFDVPEAGRLIVTARFEPGSTCCDAIALTLQRDAGAGWEDQGSANVAPDGNATFDLPAGGPYRILASPGSDGASGGQAYTLELVAWRASTSS